MLVALKRQGGARFTEMAATTSYLYNHYHCCKGFHSQASASASAAAASSQQQQQLRNLRGVKCCFQSHSNNKRNVFENPNVQLVKDVVDSELRRSDSIGLGSQQNGFHGSLNGFHGQSLSRDRIVVAVDVDEVLGNFVTALNKFIADHYAANHSVSEYHVYEFFRIWECSRDEADLRVHEFFKTSYFKSGIHPLPGAKETLHKLAEFCNLSVVTSRQNAIKDHTIQWIESHFPGLFQEIHFGNHFALDGESKPKSEICRSLGAKVLIDDNPRYAMECANVGIKVLLFDYENSYPWCKSEAIDQHPLVTRVHNWEAVEKQLMAWNVS